MRSFFFHKVLLLAGDNRRPTTRHCLRTYELVAPIAAYLSQELLVNLKFTSGMDSEQCCPWPSYRNIHEVKDRQHCFKIPWVEGQANHQ